MNEIKQELDDLFAKDKEAFDRYQSLIPDTDDISLIILKGHLIIEEVLYNLLQEHCVSPEYLDKSNLKFSQLMWILRSLLRLPLLEPVWGAISTINTLRNKLSHNLEPQDLEKYITEFDRLTRLKEPFPEAYEAPDTREKVVRSGIYYVMGQLSVITTVSTFLARRVTLDTGGDSEPNNSPNQDAQ